MKDIPDSLAPPPPRRMKMGIVIPLVFIAGVSAFLIWGIVRGNWSDTQPRNPSSTADGVMAQLLRTAEGRKQIHASVIVSAPPERVWKVVTDYDHFSDVFPNIGTVERRARPRWTLARHRRGSFIYWSLAYGPPCAA